MKLRAIGLVIMALLAVVAMVAVWYVVIAIAIALGVVVLIGLLYFLANEYLDYLADEEPEQEEVQDTTESD